MKSHTQLIGQAAGPARRQGFTLIETLVAISFGSSMMLTAVALVHTAFKLQSLTQTRLEHASTLERTVEQFRRDANLANRVELLSERSLRMFFEAEHQVEYDTDENQITRQEFDSGNLRQVEQVRLEVGRTARFTLGHSGRCVVLDVVESGSKQSTDAQRVARHIVVAVGTMNGAGEQQR